MSSPFPPGSAPQPYPEGNPYPPAPYAQPQNGSGTAALVLGLLSLFCFSILAGIPAIILGTKGRRLAREGKANNGGSATAGLVLGILSIVFAVIGAIFFTVTALAVNDAIDEVSTSVSSVSPPAGGVDEEADDKVDQGVFAFGDTVTFEDGSTLTVTGPSKLKRDEYAIGGEDFDGQVKFKLTFTNNTDEPFDPSLTRGLASSDGVEGDSVYQDDLGSPTQKVLPGKSVTWSMGYGVKNAEKVTFQISIGLLDYDDVIFTNEN